MASWDFPSQVQGIMGRAIEPSIVPLRFNVSPYSLAPAAENPKKHLCMKPVLG